VHLVKLILAFNEVSENQRKQINMHSFKYKKNSLIIESGIMVR